MVIVLIVFIMRYVHVFILLLLIYCIDAKSMTRFHMTIRIISTILLIKTKIDTTAECAHSTAVPDLAL